MNTWTHFLVNAVAKRPIANAQAKNTPNNRLPLMHGTGFLLGSVMPDIPLILMSIVTIVIDILSGAINRDTFQNGSFEETAEATKSLTAVLFDDWFFYNPWVITGHHLFGAPLLLILYAIVGYVLWKRGGKWGRFLFWFAVGCFIHTTFDIPVHTEDGPLVFFPLNWDIRIHSPVSYWDRDHHAGIVGTIEIIADILMISWLIGSWLLRRFKST